MKIKYCTIFYCEIMQDVDDDGLTPYEVNKIKDAFDVFDKDGTGYIDGAELKVKYMYIRFESIPLP